MHTVNLLANLKTTNILIADRVINSDKFSTAIDSYTRYKVHD